MSNPLTLPAHVLTLENVRVGLLGPLELESGAPLGPRDRVVLSALVLRRGRTLAPDALADALWPGDPPATWPKVVQGCISRLRRLLGNDAIVTNPSGYLLRPERVQVDVDEFEDLVSRGTEYLREGSPERAAALVDRGLELWRGRPYPELEEWSPGRLEAARLSELRLSAQEELLAARLEAGHHVEVAAEGMVLVGEEPWRERRWAILALAQYRSGRQADALSSIRAARRRLGRHLGLDPGSDLVELERAILGQDPLLAADHEARQAHSICPWLGLASYGADDRETFFGRDADIEACLARLETIPLLVLAGPSGSGKSSLLKAGLVPALRIAGHAVVTFTPGPDPAASMAAARAGASGEPTLCVDQFEEAFARGADPAATRAWLGELAAYATGHAPVILTLRADFLPELALQPDFARLAERGLHLVAPLAGAALREAVEGPARVAGVRLEHGLVDLLMRDAEHQPGALPLLSHALAETWERREGTLMTVEGYRASGGISGAVASSADRLHESLSADGRAQLRWLMLRMGTLADHGEPVRTPVPREVAATDPERARVLDLLVRSRLVTTDEGSFDLAHESLIRAWPRLRGWLEEDRAGQRLWRHLAAASAEWVALGRPDSELYSGVRLEVALEWATHPTALPTPQEQEFLDASRAHADAERAELTRQAGHERRQNRRLRGLLASAATMLVLALVAVLLAVDQSRTVADERDAATEARGLAQHESLVARSLGLRSSKRAVAALLAVEAYRARPGSLAESALLGTFTAAAGFLGYTSVPHARIQGDTVPGTSRAVVAAGTRLHLVDLETGSLGPVFDHPVRSDRLLTSVVRVSSDGRRVAQLVFAPDDLDDCDDYDAFIHSDGAGCTMLVVFDIETRKPVFGPVSTPVLGGDLAINDNGRLVAVGGGFDGDLLTYDVDRGRLLGRLDAPPRPKDAYNVRDTAAVTFGDRSHVYVAPLAGDVREVDARSLRVVRTLPAPPATMHNFLTHTPAGLLVGTGDRGMVAIDTGSGRRRWSIDFGSDPRSIPCYSFAAAPAVDRLYCGTEFGEIHELDIADGRPTGTQLDSQLGAVGDLAVSGANELVEFSRGYYSRWRLDGSGPISRLVAPGDMTIAGYSASGRYLHVAPRGRFHPQRILDVGTGQVVTTLRQEPRWVSWLGRDELFVREESRVVSVDARSGRLSPRPHELMSALGLFPNGDESTAWVVTPYTETLNGEEFFKLQRIDLASGERVGEAFGFEGFLFKVEGAADGERLWLSYYQDRGSYLAGEGEANDRGTLVDLSGGTLTDLAVAASAFSRDGRLVGDDLRGNLREFDPRTGEAIASLPGSRGAVAALQFSADGTVLVSSGRDGRVQVYDTESWTSLGAIPSGGFYDVTSDSAWRAPPDGFVRPDGEAVAVNQRLGVVEWSLVPAEMAEAACRLAGRNLTRSEWSTYLAEAAYRRTCPAYPAGE